MSAFRGLLFAVPIGIVMWAVVIAGVWWMLR